MKRRDFEKHLQQQGCFLHHHGGGHDVWINPATRRKAPVKRQRELHPEYARGVCKQLGVDKPRGV